MEPLGSATNCPDEEEAARSIHFKMLIALLGLEPVRECGYQ
jgi:hypothetical protein